MIAKTVNSHNIANWKEDVYKSVLFYNDWFVNYAPEAYKKTRSQTAGSVTSALEITNFLFDISPAKIIEHPEILPILRMSTVPPIARDRLTGLSQAPKSLVDSIDKNKRIPTRKTKEVLESGLEKISNTLKSMLDTDIFTWIATGKLPTEEEETRASIIIADRLCGMVADPIIRNAQEQRQLASIRQWLEARDYKMAARTVNESDPTSMQPGTFSFRLNVPVVLDGGLNINIPVDAVIQPKNAKQGSMPLLMEAKSAGDFTNTNKRRKEEAIKFSQLKRTYGSETKFFLFLCGYFDSGYLGYEAAEGIDWVWEHRIDDLSLFDL